MLKNPKYSQRILTQKWTFHNSTSQFTFINTDSPYFRSFAIHSPDSHTHFRQIHFSLIVYINTL